MWVKIGEEIKEVEGMAEKMSGEERKGREEEKQKERGKEGGVRRETYFKPVNFIHLEQARNHQKLSKVTLLRIPNKYN